MKARRTFIGILLWAAALTAILVPCFGLFGEGDWLFYVLRDPAMRNAWIETGILAVLIAAICLLLPKRSLRAGAFLVLLLIVSYLHGMLMPVLFAAVYFLLICSSGLVEGMAAVIVAAAVLSLFRICTPVTLLAVAAAAALLNCRSFRTDVQRIREWLQKDSPRQERLFAGLVFLVVLVQIARANRCMDFDSLWYGVRSSFVLAPNGSIFEDLGLVGMVYTYPKGFEILTLPLSGTPSYAVITAFNLCLFLYGLRETGRIAELLAGKNYAQPAMALTALVPGIVNMTLSAKPDIITWVLQLMMLRIFFETVRGQETKDRKYGCLQVLAVYLLSLTMKPTALIFSTALFGMMCIYGAAAWLKRRKAEKSASEKTDAEMTAAKNNAEEKNTAEEKGTAEENAETDVPEKRPGKARAVSQLLLSVAALAAVCIRTFLLTGMPFTSVFTGILQKLGFTLKYPFAVSQLPQSYQEGPAALTALKRAGKMLLMPDGKDMSHVLIAWGGSLFFVLGILILAGWITAGAGKKAAKKRPAEKKPAENKETVQFGAVQTETMQPGTVPVSAAYTVFLPLAAVCFITLSMLYQVDGNYYMIFYSAVIFLACLAAGDLPRGAAKAPLALLCGFQFVMMTMTNWAGVTGFTEIRLNRGYFDHQAYYREVLTETDGTIYDRLAAEPGARLVAFGTHPDCLQFPCIAESYNDITSPWGNVEIVNSARAFEEYLQFMQADYVYADADHLKEEAWQWSRGLLEEMTADGTLYDFVYEGDNWLARVRR